MRRAIALLLCLLMLPGCGISVGWVEIESDLPGVAEALFRAQQASGLMPHCPEGAEGEYRTRTVRGRYAGSQPATSIVVRCSSATAWW